MYPRESRLDNAFVQITPVHAQVLLLNLYQDTLVAYSADSHITLYHIRENPGTSAAVYCIFCIFLYTGKIGFLLLEHGSRYGKLEFVY